MLKNILAMMMFLSSSCVNLYSTAQNLPAKKLYVNILDNDGSFERKFLYNHANLIYDKCPVTIEKIFGDSSLSKHYKITRKYLPTDTNKFPDMSNSEEYFLRIFQNENIYQENVAINISATPVYSTWFSNYLHVNIKNIFIRQDKKEGMLPFLNTNHLTLLDEPEENKQIQLSDDELKTKASIAMNQLFEMAGAVARQVEQQYNITHRNILAIFIISQLKIMNIPDDTFINYIHNILPSYNIIKLVSFMSDIAKAVEYLHDHDIAHGDIKLSNLFVIEDRVMLSGFERFSLLNSDNDATPKKFTFYNNIYHAPEIRFPMGKNSKWAYTHATFAGDIYSLGMLFAGVLSMCLPAEYSFILLTMNKELQGHVKTEQLKSVLFNRYPNGIKQYIKNKFPQTLLANFYLYKNKFSSYFVDATKEDELNIFLQLVTLINKCHKEEPTKRPTAKKIADDLADILTNHTK